MVKLSSNYMLRTSKMVQIGKFQVDNPQISSWCKQIKGKYFVKLDNFQL